MDPYVLKPNASGRAWAEDPAGWERLCSAQACPHCEGGPNERLWVLAETDLVRVSGWPEAPLPGYVCVFCRNHVIEPFELSEPDQAQFFLDCMAVARGVAAVLQPIKMNYEIHGNTVPHLHMHLFPRTANDVYVGLPNHCRAIFERSSAELDRIGAAVRASLGARLIDSLGEDD